jgi:hypothetical protein
VKIQNSLTTSSGREVRELIFLSYKTNTVKSFQIGFVVHFAKTYISGQSEDYKQTWWFDSCPCGINVKSPVWTEQYNKRTLEQSKISETQYTRMISTPQLL